MKCCLPPIIVKFLNFSTLAGFILATNIAETSITIPGIKYVVDCGKAKLRAYDPVTGIDTLKVAWISKAQAWQRVGRAGRLKNGICYRTYSKEDFKAMEKNSKPEILRCSIAASTLQLLALGIDCREFDFLDKPPLNAIESALQELKNLGANLSIDTPTLTTVGRKMAKLSLDPKYAKRPKSSSAARNSVASRKFLPSSPCSPARTSSSATAKGGTSSWPPIPSFTQVHHITLLNVFNEYKTKDKSKRWCFDNFLLERNLSHMASVRTQLSDICHTLGLQFTSCGNDPVPVVKCLLTGLNKNIAELQRDNSYLTLSNRMPSKIHPSSVLSGRAGPDICCSRSC